ncbi:MAG: prefoldin subunit [Candidatus Diapherotrites archaeon]|nr:prefoldin subunit [Candidatus Diapherotrites archaeon]
MNDEEKRAAIIEFERNRQFLAGISAQKQQLSFQKEIMQASLDELGKSKEESVLKAVGNILIKKGKKEMEKEIAEKKENVELRLKTIQKQEETVLKKLNSIKSEIEGAAKKSPEGKKEPKKKAGK